MTENQIVLFLIRALVAVVMLYNGWPKVSNFKSNVKDFSKMGFQPATFFGAIATFIEFFGGVAVLLGFYAELAAALFAFEMLVCILWKKIKMKDSFSDYLENIELLVLCLVILSFGGGSYSLMPINGRIFLAWPFLLASITISLFIVSQNKPFVVKKRISTDYENQKSN